jgi:hypothetical protein
MAGQGYRHLWAAPVQIPVADLTELGGGGLTPLRLGGGMTTQTLHLSGADGRRYVFRSVQKVTQQALAEEFWGTPVEEIMKDQLCSFHPSGALIVDRLLDAVGVLHPSPSLLVVPDDPRLGEFREQFAGMLVLFEERPDDGPDGGEGFGGSRRIVSTEDLFDELEENTGDRIDVEGLLTSRLVDLLVGDRDRSINNHLWARFDEADGGHLWKVIPRDRDQSFVRFDGFIKDVARNFDLRLVSFGDEFSDVRGLTRNAWDIDRNLLVTLGREEWDSVVARVSAAITDQVIKEAVARLPREHFEKVGEELEISLRSRRDHLGEAAEGLYSIIFHEADLHATDGSEVAVLSRRDGGEVGLSIYRRAANGQRTGPPLVQQTFSPLETRELRLYLHGGDDLAQVEGSLDASIKLRIVGGGGDDEVSVSGGGRDVIFYDAGKGSLLSGEGGKLVRRGVSRPYSWWSDGEQASDFGKRISPEPGSISYDSDRGLMLALGFKRDRYGFARDPYRSRTRMKGGWAFGWSEPLVEIEHIRPGLLFGGDLHLNGGYSGFDVVRFYGLGNATPQPEPHEYYEVHQKQLALGASLAFGNGETSRLVIGPLFKRTASDTTNPTTLVAEANEYGTGTFQQAGVVASFDFDRRANRHAPTEGYRFSGGVSFYPEMLDVESPYGEIHGEASTYLSPGSGNPTLAMRVGAKRLFGTFPYFDAAFLGGSGSVRGLREQRFAGEAAVYGSAELRVFLTNFHFVFPMDLGALVLTDVGRVFQDDTPSGEWKTSLGVGIWLAPLNRDHTVQLSMARGGGRRAFYIGMGFAY